MDIRKFTPTVNLYSGRLNEIKEDVLSEALKLRSSVYADAGYIDRATLGTSLNKDETDISATHVVSISNKALTGYCRLVPTKNHLAPEVQRFCVKREFRNNTDGSGVVFSLFAELIAISLRSDYPILQITIDNRFLKFCRRVNLSIETAGAPFFYMGSDCTPCILDYRKTLAINKENPVFEFTYNYLRNLGLTNV